MKLSERSLAMLCVRVVINYTEQSLCFRIIVFIIVLYKHATILMALVAGRERENFACVSNQNCFNTRTRNILLFIQIIIAMLNKINRPGFYSSELDD